MRKKMHPRESSSVKEVLQNQDILGEIFIRLPVKSLLQICCVRKLWYSIISSPCFIKNHAHFTIMNADNDSGTKTTPCYIIRELPGDYPGDIYNFMFDDYNGEESVIRCQQACCPFNVNPDIYKHVGSCFGLVCVAYSWARKVGSYKQIILWNPSLRKSMELPAYGHDDCQVIVGFGFDFKRFDYKVVRIVHNRYDLQDVDVYELNVGAWRSIKNKFSLSLPFVVILDSIPAFVNGSIYWVGFDRNRDDARLKPIIVAFDVAGEEFRIINMPDEIHDGRTIHIFVVFPLGNSLGLIAQEMHISRVWVMKEYGESWTKLYDVRLPEHYSFMLGVHQSDERLFILKPKGNLALYNPKTKEINELNVRCHPTGICLDTNYSEVLTLWKCQERI